MAKAGVAPRAMARVIPLMGPSPSMAVTERVILTMRNDVEVSRDGAAVGAPTAQAGVAIRCFGGHVGDGWMAIGGDEGFLKVGADGFDLFASRPTHQCLMLTWLRASLPPSLARVRTRAVRVRSLPPPPVTAFR